MKVIILMGAPGCGKGSSAKLLHDYLNIPHISTGDILREAVDNQSYLGKKISSILEKGMLVPDDIMLELIEEHIQHNLDKDGLILDGFPRNLYQAEALDKVFEKYFIKDYIVVELKVAADVITKRILGRYICSECGAIYNKFYNPPQTPNVCDKCGSTKFISRNDDNETTIANRLSIYNQNSLPILKFYENKNKLYSIDGTLTKEEVFNKILGLYNNI